MLENCQIFISFSDLVLVIFYSVYHFFKVDHMGCSRGCTMHQLKAIFSMLNQSKVMIYAKSCSSRVVNLNVLGVFFYMISKLFTTIWYKQFTIHKWGKLGMLKREFCILIFKNIFKAKFLTYMSPHCG